MKQKFGIYRWFCECLIISILILQGCATVEFRPIEFQVNPDKKLPIKIPFNLKPYIILEVSSIDSNPGPFNFFLDSGSSEMCFLGKETLQKIAKKWKTIWSWGRFCVPTFTINGINLQNLRGITLSDKLFKNFSDNHNIQIHGGIGLSFFLAFVIEVDYLKNELILYDPLDFQKDEKGIPVEFTSKGQALIKVKIDNKRSARLLIDTCGYTSIPSNKLESEVYYEQRAMDVTGHEEYKKVSLLESMQINEINIPNVEVFSSKEKYGIIGHNVLKRFNVIFDYPHGRIFLYPNDRFYEIAKEEKEYFQSFFRFSQANKYVKEGKYNEAMDIYKKILEKDPNDKVAYMYIASIYNDLKQYETAIEYLKEAMKIDPNYVSVFFNFGNIYHNLKMYEEAVKYYKQTIKLDPNYPFVHHRLGITYLCLNDKDSAMEEYKILKNLDNKLAEELLNMINDVYFNESGKIK